ncbi:MAG: PRD domain-containing protein [Erysipelotrichaceae bacterium]|nr:PRD domain-containing protein [Erysipelotrichaceae bacterium]
MKVIKSINNNVAHCFDSKGREVIVFGRGIGFYKAGEEIPLSSINRTFYNVKDTDFGVLKAIPTVIINTAIYIIDYVSDELSLYFPSSTALALADHLHFAIVRKNQNIYLPQPIIQDIQQLYPDEMRVALKSLEIIKKMTGEKLPRMEAGTLAMHFINDRLQTADLENPNTEEISETCTRIIERHFDIKIDREGFNYSRFITHLDFLIRRILNNEQIKSENEHMYDEMVAKYPDTCECVTKLCDYLVQKTSIPLGKEEMLYLAIHINRMISRM